MSITRTILLTPAGALRQTICLEYKRKVEIIGKIKFVQMPSESPGTPVNVLGPAVVKLYAEPGKKKKKKFREASQFSHNLLCVFMYIKTKFPSIFQKSGADPDMGRPPPPLFWQL